MMKANTKNLSKVSRKFWKTKHRIENGVGPLCNIYACQRPLNEPKYLSGPLFRAMFFYVMPKWRSFSWRNRRWSFHSFPLLLIIPGKERNSFDYFCKTAMHLIELIKLFPLLLWTYIYFLSFLFIYLFDLSSVTIYFIT